MPRFERLGWPVAFIAIGALALMTVLVVAREAGAGPLDPPAPAAGPTGTQKTQNEVEPRTPISSLPFTISQPGSYYLTGNLTPAAGQGGIFIDANYVSIDLNGFTLSRGPGGSGHGIAAAPGRAVITVRNGNVAEWQLDGINLPSNSHVTIERVDASANGGSGIVVGARAVIRDGRAAANGLNGIRATGSALIASNTAEGNVRMGIVAEGQVLITGNQSTSNGYAGIHVHVATGSRVEGNNVANNVGWGVLVESSNNAIVRNTATGSADNFSIVAGNFAPEQTAPSVTDPWANINY